MEDQQIRSTVKSNSKKVKKRLKHKRKSNKEDSSASDKKSDTEKQKSEEFTRKITYNDRFEITGSMLLAMGSFGEIYIAYDIMMRNYCAMKLETQKNRHPQLKNEKIVIETMADHIGFPKFIDYGIEKESTYIAMEILGPNLADLFLYCNNRFSLQTVLLIGIQMLNRIQDLHSKNYIHRDIKPENFLIGIDENSNIIYLIDFGLSKKYKDPKTMDHIPYRENRSLTGTARYASINTHLGIEQSRRDDLEAIGYVMIYLLKSRLPWQGCQGSNKQDKYNKILEKKLSLPIEVLCKDLPIEFTLYMNYVKNIRFDERPDYNFLKGIFIDLLITQYEQKFMFDWILGSSEEIPNKKAKVSPLKEKVRREVKSFSQTNLASIEDIKMKKFQTDKHINLNINEIAGKIRLNNSGRIREESFSEKNDEDQSDMTERHVGFDGNEFEKVFGSLIDISHSPKLSHKKISKEKTFLKSAKAKSITTNFMKISDIDKI